MVEMYRSGELEALLVKNGIIERTPPVDGMLWFVAQLTLAVEGQGQV